MPVSVSFRDDLAPEQLSLKATEVARARITFFVVRAHDGIVPRIANSAYVDENAQVIGDVVIGEHSSIWPHATVRGDLNSIRIGNDTKCSGQCSVALRTGAVPAQHWKQSYD